MIKHLRSKKGLSQSQLAEKLRLSTSHVSRMERKVKGYRASYRTIKLLSKELEICPIKVFLFFSDIYCRVFKIDTEMNDFVKCEFENCINYDCKQMKFDISKEIARLKSENSRLKRTLRTQTRIKKYRFCTRNRNYRTCN
jgi:transcriptional regulator with XRE-family HTH domain